MAATHSIESSYFHSFSTSFNKSLKLVRDQGVGGSFQPALGSVLIWVIIYLAKRALLDCVVLIAEVEDVPAQHTGVLAIFTPAAGHLIALVLRHSFEFL